MSHSPGEQPSPVNFKTLVILAKGLLHPETPITHRMALKEITAACDQLDREEPSTLRIVVDVLAAWSDEVGAGSARLRAAAGEQLVTESR